MNSLVGGSDYQEIIAAPNLDVFLTFDNENRQHSFDVTIIDDLLCEFDGEDFTLELRFDLLEFEPHSIILSPNVSTVEIIDDDGKI